MKPKEVKDYYENAYRFAKATGMSPGSLSNWLKWGYIPDYSQFRLERLTKGKLKAEYKDDLENKNSPREDDAKEGSVE